MGKARPLIKMDMAGNELQRYESINEAVADVQIDRSQISRAVRGIYRSAGGFRWKYAEIIKKEKPKPQKQKKKSGLKYGSLCCYCNTPSPTCSWKRNFTPVEGWEAEPTRIGTQVRGKDGAIKREYVPSFLVTSCPKFILRKD